MDHSKDKINKVKYMKTQKLHYFTLDARNKQKNEFETFVYSIEFNFYFVFSLEFCRTVKEHIERLKYIIQMQNGQLLNTDWQAIAPPMYAYHYKTPTNNIFSSLSSVGSSQIQNENLYDTQSDYIETDSGSAGRSSGGGSDFFIPNISLSCKQCHSNTTEDPYSFLNTSDDQNISFSKNGTEIHDFNPDQEQTSQFIKKYVSVINQFQLKNIFILTTLIFFSVWR